MDELLGVLCGLGIVLAIVTLLGHGLWLVLAAIARALLGTGGASQAASGSPCAVCGDVRGVSGGRCRVCGAPATVTQDQHERVELLATRRRLNRWLARGALSPDVYAAVSSLLDTDERQGSKGSPTPAASAEATAATPFSVSPTPFATQAADRVPGAESVDSASGAVVVPSPDLLRPVGHPGSLAAEPILVAEIVEPTNAAVPAIPSSQAIPDPHAADTTAIATPRRTLADVLQAFMEEKNIRWVEIISGVLIVVSALGLVISLRATLKDKIPYFPALSFMLVTGAIHAAGIYSLRRWNLKWTSRGVLIIATLLVPLNFLAAIILSGMGEQQRPINDPIFYVAVAIGIVSFATMNYFASRALMRHGWSRLMLAVMGTSCGQLVINRLQPEGSSPLTAAALLMIPVGSFLCATSLLLRSTVRRFQLGQRHAQQYFLELGIGSFALLAPVGLFVAKSQDTTQALGDLSPILSLAACAIVAVGLLAHQRIVSPDLSSYRTAGTALVILGGGIMFLMVAFAWPQLELLVAVGLINFFLLTLLAVLAQLSLLHVPAVACLAIALLSGFHLWRGLPDSTAPSSPAARIVIATFTGPSALALTVLTTLVAAAGAGLWTRRRNDGRHYLLASGGLGLACVVISIYAGFFVPASDQGDLATPILFYFSVIALAVGWIVPRAEAAWLGSGLLFVAALHGLSKNLWLQSQLDSLAWWPDHSVLLSLLLHSVLVTLVSVAANWRGRALHSELAEGKSGAVDSKRLDSFAAPLGWSAIATSIAAALLALGVIDEHYGERAVYFLAASVAWLGFARIRSPIASFAVFQVLTTLSLAFATTAICARQSSWRGDLWAAEHLHVQLAVLAASCGGWALIRRYSSARAEDSGWLWRSYSDATASETGASRTQPQPPEVYISPSVQLTKRYWAESVWPTGISVDQCLLGALTVCGLGLSLLGCLPGILVELGIPRVDKNEILATSTHQLWYASGAWWGIGLIILALAANLWQQRWVALIGIIVATAAIPQLISARFDDQYSVASALRWVWAIWGVAWCLPACYWGGERTRQQTGWTIGERWTMQPSHAMRVVSMAFVATALLSLTTAAVWSVGVGNLPGGPAVGSIFYRMGSSISYATPLLTLVVILSAYAIREAKSDYAFAASLVFQYAVSLACLLPVLSSGASWDEEVMARLLQSNFAGLAIFTTAWIGVLHWLEPGRSLTLWPPSRHNLLAWQVVMLFGTQLLAVVWIVVLMVIDPSRNWPVLDILGQWLSYIAWVVGWMGILWLLRSGPRTEVTHLTSVALLVLIHFVAASVHSLDRTGQWWGHHALSAGRIVLAAAIAGWLAVLTWRRSQENGNSVWGARKAAVFWASAVLVLAALSAIRGADADPWRPAWPAGIMALAAALTGFLGVCTRRQGFAYIATVAAGVAATLLWIGLSAGHPLRHAAGFWALHVLAVDIAAVIWLACEIYLQRRGEPGLDTRLYLPPAHHCVGIVATILAAFYALAAALLICIGGRTPPLNQLELSIAILAWLSLLASFVGALWDRRAKYGIAGLYVGCLSVEVFAVGQIPLPPVTRVVTLLAVVATHIALSGWIWSWGSKLAGVGLRLGIVDPVAGLRRTSQWLPLVTVILAAGVSSMSVLVVLSSESRGLRVIAASLPLLLAAGTAGLAQMQRRDRMQLLSFVFLGLAGALLGLADVAPDWTERTVLLRAIRLLMALCALTFLYGVVAVRVLTSESGWRQAARRAAVLAGALAGAALLIVMGVEAVTFQPGVGAPVETIHIVAVSVLLIALIIALFSLAVLPGRDPLQLSTKGRMWYVYGAQLVAGLLFAHIYLARPTIFSGFLHPWWPYIVVVIAFAGVGVGQVFQRLGWPVLAEPFERSGAFLPLIPAVGMWIVNSNSDYSLVLFAIGVLYLIFSLAQKSVLAGMAAAVAGNGSLWSLLRGTEDLTFSRHPQFWLIPPAVSVLIAAQINRQRLSEGQLASIRYVTMSVVYISSCYEMLKLGIGQSLWPPVILITLAIAGVFFGIAMQVRAYLYLGAIFILVGMISMVAHAARSIHHVWPWWAFGFAMGVMLLVVFGWFESRRAQTIELVHRLRKWER